MDNTEVSVEPPTPEPLLSMSHGVLACPIVDLPATPVTQLAVGWLRAAHDQLGAIAELTLAGRLSATAPNARSFSELAIRLIWLHAVEDRSTVMPALVKNERNLAEKHVLHSEAMGVVIKMDEDLTSLVLTELGNIDESLVSQARGVVDAAKAAVHAGGIYQLWQNSTQFAHATTQAAVGWAPVDDDSESFTDATPDKDWTRALHLASILICTFVGQILQDEGANPDAALKFMIASITCATTSAN